MNSSRSSLTLREPQAEPTVPDTSAIEIITKTLARPSLLAKPSLLRKPTKDATEVRKSPGSLEAKGNATELPDEEKGRPPMCDLKRVVTPKGELLYGKHPKGNISVSVLISYEQLAGMVPMTRRIREIGLLPKNGFFRLLVSFSARERFVHHSAMIC